MATILEADPLAFFVAIAALMFLGFAGQLIFARLRFNDTLILIAVGFVLGQFGVAERESLESVRELVGPLALILILFEGGLALRFRELLQGLPSATVLAVLGFTATAFSVGALTSFLLGVPFLTGLILGATLAGTSAVVVLPALKNMKTSPKTSAILNLEAAITDVLVVVVAFTLISISALGVGAGAQPIASKLVITFAMSILVGLAFAFVWLQMVPHVRDKPYGYMLTLGVMFALYSLVEWLLRGVSSGGGPLAVLAFGVLIGNASSIGNWMQRRVGDDFVPGIQRFQGEISFLVRTFFFVYLGMIVDRHLFSPRILLIGFALFGVMVVARYVAVVFTTRSPRLRGDAAVIWVMMPRGLAAAVVAAIPATVPYEIPGTDDFVALAFIGLVLTNLMSTVGSFVLDGRPDDEVGRKLAKAAKSARKSSKRQAKASSKQQRAMARPPPKEVPEVGGRPPESVVEFKEADDGKRQSRDRPRRKE